MIFQSTVESWNRSGSCNMCSRHVTPKGMLDHEVTVLHIGNPGGNPGTVTELRFCHQCLTEFKNLVWKWLEQQADA